MKHNRKFHWQDYSDKGYLQALSHLKDMRSEGLIKAIGLCNFDAIRTDEICTQLGPGSIVSNQVQVHGSSSLKALSLQLKHVLAAVFLD